MKKLLLPIIALIFLFSSCELLEQAASESGLSEDEIVEGLKTALTVGTDSSSTALSLEDGYYGDALVKIPLPDEAEDLRNLINSYSTLASLSESLGLEDKFEDVILSVNRAAEDAASEAAPIFKEAITDLDISEGLSILNGQVPETETSTIGLKESDFDSTAATQYLSNETYDTLTGLYAPQINTSLSKDLVGSVSAVDAWESLTSAYNSFINNSSVKAAITAAALLGTDIDLPEEINTDLGEFSTQKALDGLFYKVGEEEKNIRRDPLDWISTTVGTILQKVFGSE